MACTIVKKEVKHIFKELGIKPTLNGYYYWPVAVEEAMKRGELNYKICRDIYAIVGEKFDITPSNAERCMRTITNSCQIRIKKLFDVNLDKVTNKDFLALIIEKIRERREESESKAFRT